ncbi:phenylalanine--tRNA ligase subunit alpha [Candidatus Parcubacteria bacterium]|nr:phenylalanine--tRNA ligase subunit alpha [Candidatus Parcubacteria bacterium]
MATTEEKLKKLGLEAREKIKDIVGRADLETWRVKYLGRKGALADLTKTIGALGSPERARAGQALNALKKELVQAFRQAGQLTQGERRIERIDLTQPGKRASRGHLHPLTKVLWEIEDIFSAMGFAVVDGPEVVSEYDNFDSLNMPPDHPAREMWDTIWLRQIEIKNQKANIKNAGRLLLRAHTSAFQVRYMRAHAPPFRIVIPGRVYRYEATDATHETQFYQVEGLMVGPDVSAANFRGVMQEFFRRLFRKEVKLRLRPGYFPFTEPSFEMDMACLSCGQKGCVVCKQSGWIELMGAGMVHQNVFAAAGYVRGEWQGFAFGMSLERPTMMRYGINDIRLFHSGDLRFLRQF